MDHDGCETKEGICTTPSVTITKLPLHTNLVEVAGKIRDETGVLEYEITCAGEIPFEDKCSGTTSAAVENVSGGVDATFDSKSEKLTCTPGGSSEGAVEGADLIGNPTSGTLTAANAVEGWWLNGELIRSAKPAKASAKLKFEFPKGGPLGETVSVECKVASEGTVGAGLADETTHLSATGCEVGLGTCPEPSVTALYLPWHTELATIEGGTRDLITSGTSKPQYELKCKGEVDYVCPWAASTAIANVSEGVDGTFDSKADALRCAYDGFAGEVASIYGTELIHVSGSTLTVK